MGEIGQWLFPATPRRIPYERAWNVGLRTAHIAVVSLLVGGHYFDAPQHELRGLLYLVIATGAGLIALGIYPSCRWFFEGRGLVCLVKLAVLCLFRFFGSSAWPCFCWW
jgi:hypothetical protein